MSNKKSDTKGTSETMTPADEIDALNEEMDELDRADALAGTRGTPARDRRRVEIYARLHELNNVEQANADPRCDHDADDNDMLEPQHPEPVWCAGGQCVQDRHGYVNHKGVIRSSRVEPLEDFTLTTHLWRFDEPNQPLNRPYLEVKVSGMATAEGTLTIGALRSWIEHLTADLRDMESKEVTR